jgi:hypothetical protein
VTQQIFSDRSNANRKAKLMISKGEAIGPFKVEKRGEREFVLVWNQPETSQATERASKRQERQDKAEARKARIQASQAAAAPAAKPAKAPKAPKVEPAAKRNGHRGPRGSKYDTAALPAGTMPPKPVITSPGNPGLQKHVDNLTALANAGKWDDVAAYPLSQSTTQFYPKILRRYREQLLAAKSA